MEVNFIHAKKRSSGILTKNFINQAFNSLSFDHTVIWTVYK